MEKKLKSDLATFSRLLRKMLEEAKTESPESGLLGLIPSSTRVCDSTHSSWMNLGRSPSAREIDYEQTSDEMLIDGTAILIDGKRICWQNLGSRMR